MSAPNPVPTTNLSASLAQKSSSCDSPVKRASLKMPFCHGKIVAKSRPDWTAHYGDGDQRTKMKLQEMINAAGLRYSILLKEANLVRGTSRRHSIYLKELVY
jgi:hypothetical protein